MNPYYSRNEPPSDSRSAVRVEVEATLDRVSQITTGRLRARLPVSLAEIAALADPQVWHRWPSFRQSYKVMSTPAGYERDPTPPPVGSSWVGELFEHYQMSLGYFEVNSFHNILNIDYSVTPERVRTNYSLRQALAGNVWYSPFPIGVDVDSGHLIASPEPDGVDLEVLKKVRFVNLTGSGQRGLHATLANQLTPFALKLWLRTLIPAVTLATHPSSRAAIG